MRILALNPYERGSHRAFVDGWRAHSEHRIAALGLPGRHWKWRMRHGAWTLAARARELLDRGEAFDAVFATDMLDLPAWRAFAPPSLERLPAVVYFHENQLMYPAPQGGPPDLHFGFTNLMSAALADEVWFNSAWHREGFLRACRELLARMPDCAPMDALGRAEARSHIYHPGFALAGETASAPAERGDGAPCHILWAARWEHDKAPEDLFAALGRLQARGVAFRVSAIGRAGSGEPPLFARAREKLGVHVARWGWQASREDYEAALRAADVVVSTARHEFFGIAAVEAVAAGAFPLLPARLAYPEVFAGFAREGFDDGTYDGSVEHLAERLEELCQRHARRDLWQGEPDRGRRSVARYSWPGVARAMDGRLAAIAGLQNAPG